MIGTRGHSEKLMKFTDQTRHCLYTHVSDIDNAMTRVLQNIVGSHNLRTSTFILLTATNTEMDRMDIKYVRWEEMVGFENSINAMFSDKWSRVVLDGDLFTDTNACSSQVKHILDMTPDLQSEAMIKCINLDKLQTELLDKLDKTKWYD